MTDPAFRKILRVNLTTGLCWFESLNTETIQEHPGGRALGTALLSGYGGSEPFSADTPLVFTTGPLCCTSAPMSSRCTMTVHSPLTDTIFSNSAGGSFAFALKSCGLAALLIEGACNTPSILQITPDRAEILPAVSLWGADTETAIKKLPEVAGRAVIGPAGENLVLYASIVTGSGEPFGRGGTGALMGHKRLKAVTVEGDIKTPIADSSSLDTAIEDVMRLFRASPFLLGPLGIHENGDAALTDMLLQRGMLPGENFKSFHGVSASINAAGLRSSYQSEAGGCYDCQLACKRLLHDGSVLPEYLSLASFGGLCGQTDLKKIVRLCKICGDLGLDPVSSASTIAAWAEITGNELKRLDIEQLLYQIAIGSGDGKLLSQGAARTASQLGQPEKAICVKGLELPPFDPRASTALALAYVTSTNGGSHLPAWPLTTEILRKPVPTDRFTFDGKARLISMFEDANAAFDSLVLCRYASAAIGIEEAAALLAAVTGERYNAADLLKIGRKTIAIERDFNLGKGFTEADDRLPERFFTESANGLPPVDMQRFQQELEAYQRIRITQA